MVDILNQQNNNNGLDFSKGFQYQNQDLGSVQISEAEDKKLKRQRMEKYLGVSISNSKPDEEEVRSYVKRLNSSDRAIVNHLADEGYSYNEIVAYMGQKDRFADPMATGTGIFERKPHQFDPRNPVTQTVTGLGAAEGGGALLEKKGERIMKNAYGETKKDVLKDITYQKNQELKDFYGNKAKQVEKQIGELVKNGGDEQQLAQLQEERDRLLKLQQRYTTPEPTSTADVAAEFELVGDDRGLAVDAGVNKTKMWTEEVQPLLEKSETKRKITDFLDDLKYEDFGNINEYNRKEYQSVIDDMKKVYADVPEKSLAELYDWKKRTQLSSNAIKGDESKAIVRNIQDKLYTKVNDTITKTLENENKGMGVGEKIKKYGLLTEFEEGASKAAISDATKATKAGDAAATPMELAGKKINELSVSKKWKTRLGKVMKNAGKYIRPSTYLSMGKNFLVETLGADAVKVENAIKGLGKAEKLTGKTFSKFLGALGDLAEPLVLLDTGVKLKKYEDIIDVLPLMQAKVQWTKGGKGFEDAEWYGWTEEDWDKIGLGKDDVAEILNSDEFENFLSSITWGGSNRDFVRNSYAPLLQ